MIVNSTWLETVSDIEAHGKEIQFLCHHAVLISKTR